MKIVGCDLHTRYQQIAMLDRETGELVERRLEHESGEARSFYAGLSAPVRVGIEATGHRRWFEGMLAEFGHELWIGDGAQIRAAMVRKQKTDARDAAHLLELLLSDRFPRIWRPSLEERDLRPRRAVFETCSARKGSPTGPNRGPARAENRRIGAAGPEPLPGGRHPLHPGRQCRLGGR